MLKALLLTPALFLFSAVPQATSNQSASGQPTPDASAGAPTTIPAAAAAAKNPVTPTPESQAFVRRMYSYDCALCHGEAGKGKGEMAESMKLNLKDLSKPDALAGRTDGELFWIIKNGYGQMPSEGARLNDTQLWNMVLYVRSLSK